MICNSTDIKRVQRILEHDSVFYSASDDGIENNNLLGKQVLSDPHFICLMPHKNALFLFRALNYIMYEMHIAIIEGDTRKKGTNHAVEAARWMFTNTPCRKLITHIPEYHLRAIMFSQVCGMTKEGHIENSFLKDGRLHNLVVLGGTKERFNTLHGEN